VKVATTRVGALDGDAKTVSSTCSCRALHRPARRLDIENTRILHELLRKFDLKKLEAVK